MQPIRKRSAAVSIALGLVAVGSPAAEASAAIPSPPSTSPGPALPFAPNALPSVPRLSFIPPAVGEIGVAIGPIIIGGKLINPGLKVTKPAVTLEPVGPIGPS